MPNRIIRPGIISSDRVNELTAPAEVFYRRLMSVADDFGRFDGDWRVLRAQLFPLRVDVITRDQIEEWLTECARVLPDENEPLVYVYFVARHRYIAITNFGQKVRSASKFPAPEEQDSVQVVGSKEERRAASAPSARGLSAVADKSPAVAAPRARDDSDSDSAYDSDSGKTPPAAAASNGGPRQHSNGKSPPGKRPSFAQARSMGLVQTVEDYNRRYKS